MKLLPLYFCASFFFFAACSSTQGEEESKKSERTTPRKTRPAEVTTIPVESKDFSQELIANGKLQAIKKANLSFQGSGIIESVHVTEGMRVAKGTVLATLDRQLQQQEYKQKELSHNKALLDYQDQLLRAGYQLADTAGVDKEVKRIARLRSGLSSSEYDLLRLKTELMHGQLKAPFSGQIANVQAKPHNASGAYSYICTLIDDSELEVEFQMLEQELDFVRQSKRIRLQAFSQDEAEYAGKIVSINPLVDQDGMITIHARVANHNGALMDGMSVRVIIEKSLPAQLVVPKEAVLDRQDRKVVFTLEDGLAKWNYVEIAAENSVEYAIAEGLEKGDKVIYEGNFNLAHDKPVEEIK